MHAARDTLEAGVDFLPRGTASAMDLVNHDSPDLGARRAALALFTVSAFVLILRPPLPLDETRYLEVARELGLDPLLLHLNSAPYGEKPPLAFWLAGSLRALGLPLWIGMRLLPALASAATVLLLERVGRRAGIRGAAWLYAGMLLPLAYTQVLLVDPLLTAALWWALLEWSRGRDGLATLAIALAYLTKGPVAALHVVPLALALAPLRPLHAPRAGWRLAGIVLLGAVPLAAWALYSASSGGEQFAHRLLVQQTAQRILGTPLHARSSFYYLPVLLAGALPLTLIGFTSWPRGIARRVAIAACALVLAFTAMSGKQPHYLLPLFPGFALWAAELLQRREQCVRVLQVSSIALLGALLVAWSTGTWVGRPLLLADYGDHARELYASTAWWSLWASGLLLAAWALWRLLRGRLRPAATSALLMAGFAGIALPMQYALGKLMLPAELSAALRSKRDTPLATYRAFESGYFNWAGRRDRVATLETPKQYARWCKNHPGGLIVQPTCLDAEAPPGLVADELIDLFRGEAYSLRRALAPEREAPAGMH